MKNHKNFIILGSTGSIGKAAIDVITKNKIKYNFVLLSAEKNIHEITKQIKFLKPKIFIISNLKAYNIIKKKFKNSKTLIKNNFDNYKLIKKKTDIAIAAIPGIAGLKPTIEVLKKTKKLLIANKESVICGWNLLQKEAKKNKTKMHSIDSEHFSLSKILENHDKNNIKNIYLTASGGPFLNYKKKDLDKITPSQALKHPKWKMGKKISIDSATMMNKVFEVIEANKLFSISFNKIKILIHPNSLVHAVVQLKNGLSFLLYHEPDMKIPIANSIFTKEFDINSLKNKNINDDFDKLDLKFFKPKIDSYPILNALKVVERYPSSPIIINAANEILVNNFLSKKIPFKSIIKLILNLINSKKFKKYAIYSPTNIKNIYKIDSYAREHIKEIISRNV